MRNQQHEIPTHLNVEDKLVFGLTVRQFLYLLSGASAAYGLWEQLIAAPEAVRIVLPALCLLAAAAVALIRPYGRPLEEWVVAALIYFSRPRRAIWRTHEPELADWRPAHGSWQELVPSAVWAEDEGP